MSPTLLSAEPIVYPDSDGQPMAENSLQFEYIVTTKEGLEVEFADDPQVLIEGDMLWYPVEGRPDIRMAPDAFVVFGRPKGHRGSYQQWREDGIAPQVAFEIMSPGNRAGEMQGKFEFYERYQVEEYYIYDPDRGTLRGWLRRNGRLTEIEEMHGWVSPRLGIRFELVAGELHLYHSDGRRFETFQEVHQRAEQAEADAGLAQRQAKRAKAEAKTAKDEVKSANDETKTAKNDAKAAKSEAESAQRQLRELVARLQSAGIDPSLYQ